MASLRPLKVTFDSFDDLIESIGPGLSRTYLFVRTDEEIAGGTRVRLEVGTARKGAVIRGVAKVAGPGERSSGETPVRPEAGLHLHLIHLDPSSTRFVDSIVRGELPGVGAGEQSGPSPFDIRSAEPPAPEPAPSEELATEPLEEPETPEPGPQPNEGRRLRRLGWPLALAALAGVFLLTVKLVTGGDDRLLTGSDRQTGVAEPARDAEDSGKAEGDVPEPRPEGEPAGTLLESEAPDAARRLPEAAVEQVIFAWADAWSRQDPDAYLELYAADYRPPGLDRDAWERRRRARITAPGKLQVSVSDLRVEVVGPKRAIARFHQLYVTGEKALSARKILELERLAAEWRIVAERVED